MHPPSLTHASHSLWQLAETELDLHEAWSLEEHELIMGSVDCVREICPTTVLRPILVVPELGYVAARLDMGDSARSMSLILASSSELRVIAEPTTDTSIRIEYACMHTIPPSHCPSATMTDCSGLLGGMATDCY